jgi:ferredoxin-thioredoxin reductase catalytic subunit
MTQIYRKEGWDLNPNDKVVNAILKRVEMCDGECPCVVNEYIPKEDRMCPCKSYRENDICHCKLYIKKNYENTNDY